MLLYLVNNKINYDELLANYPFELWSEIRIGNNSLIDYLKIYFSNYELITFDKGIQELDINLNDKILVMSANIFPKDLKGFDFLNYLEFLSCSYTSVYSGNDSAFIYSGSLSDFLSKTYISVNLPEIYYNLHSMKELENLLVNHHDSRAHNQITFSGSTYTKYSTDKDKLYSEYTFLKNIPQELSLWYPTVYEYKNMKENSSYSMTSYPFRDLSYSLLSHALNNLDIDILYSFLEKYFKKSQISYNLKSGTIESDFDSLITKNRFRFNQLKNNLSLYTKIDSLMKAHSSLSLDAHFNRIESLLIEKKMIYCNVDPIFSHGDLCFSNMLYDKKGKSFILIDPRGFENGGIRSPYYDLAKISHSIMGGYDLILNNRANLSLSSDIKLSLIFEEFDALNYARSKFSKVISSFGYDYNFVRLIESSLFLSMIPLHQEDELRCVKFCFISDEIFEEINNF